MIKQAISELGLAPIAVAGLLMFVIVFLGVVAWAMTRGRGTVATWASLPLADGHQPVEARQPISLDIVDGKTGGCGKCDNCTC